MVIRDVRGSVMASCSKILPQAYSGVEVEALAAAMALSFASDISFSRAVLEGDSWVVIKALMEDDSALASYGLLVDDD